MELFQYQNEGVNWMLSREHYNNINPTMPEELSSYDNIMGGILADEVGLGKTLQTITVLQNNPKSNT